MSAATERVMVRVTPEDRERLVAWAAEAGVSIGCFISRKVFDRPDEQRPVGRRPRIKRAQPEELPLSEAS